MTAEFGHNPCGDGQEAHWEVVERILFIYAKLNPGQGYVQGMNEIIGPLYYVFACDPESEWRGLFYFTERIHVSYGGFNRLRAEGKGNLLEDDGMFVFICFVS